MPTLDYGAAFLETGVNNVKAHSWDDVLVPFQKVRTLLNTTGLDTTNIQANGLEPSDLRADTGLLGVRIQVYNSTGSGLSAGDLVYLKDSTTVSGETFPNAIKAIATTSTSTTFFAQAIIESDISNNTAGTAALFSQRTGINTSSAAVGDPVYLNTSAGGYTFTRPTGGNLVQVVGVVVEDHASTGKINFFLASYPDKNPTDTLGELGDINLTSPADGSMLLYDTGTSKWIDNVMSGDATMADTGVVTLAGTNTNITSLANLVTVGTIGTGTWAATDVAVAHGGTGASSAGDARTNLGLAIGSNVQAYDAGLNSIAGLTTAANKMIYTSGSDTYAVADLSAFARTILDDADAAAVRTTIGAQAAGSYQASDAGLTSIAGLTTAADKMIYTSDSDTYAVTNLSSFARTILDDADAAAVRSTIGAGTSSVAAFTDLSDVGSTSATAGKIMVADGDSWESVAVSGDIALASSGAMTIQANSVALATDTTGNYVATIADAGNSHITVANSGSENAAVTLNITDNAVGLAQMAGLARGKIIVGDSGGNPAALAAGSNGQVLQIDSNGDAVWGSTSSGLDAANGADNRIATFTDADSLNGEANLTFDGSTLAITGSIDLSADIDVDGTLEADAITLGGTALGSLYSPIAGSSSIVTVGTISTGVWQGTAVASAYLDSDTAHLSTTQTFTGDKTFTGAVQVGDATVASAATAADELVLEGSSTGMTISSSGTTNSGSIFFGDADNNQRGRVQYNHNQDNLILSAGAAEIVNVKSTGVGIGTSSPSALLTLNGTYSSGANGPNIEFFGTATDAYPSMQILNYSHDDQSINFDNYYDGAWKSSDAGSNFQIRKGGDKLTLRYDSGISAGSTLTWNTGFVMDTSGKVGINISDPADYTDASGTVLVVGNTSGATTRSGVSIITDTSGIGRLAFGDGAGDPDQWKGVIQYTQSSDTMGFAVGGNAVGMNLVGGNLYIGDSANGKMTKGLTINQGSGVDNEALALKSSTDVAHDCTDVAETDTYGTFTKIYGDQGGLKVSGFVDSGAQAALDLEGVTSHASPQSGKTSSNNGTVNIRAYKVSSNDRAQLSANENILSIYDGSATRFIFDADGDAYADSQWTTYDDHDDIAMLHDIEATMIPDLFGKCMKYDSEYLQKTGIIGEGSIRQENGKTRAMINTNRLQMLHHGAIRQVHQQLQDVKEFYEDKLAALEARLLRLEA